MHVVDHRLRQAGLERHLLVDVPFELRVAMPPGDEDGELLEMRRQRGAEAQELAELLPLVGELGAMQHRAQRTAQPRGPATTTSWTRRCSGVISSLGKSGMRGNGCLLSLFRMRCDP